MKLSRDILITNFNWKDIRFYRFFQSASSSPERIAFN